MGRSFLVGRPLALMLSARGADATVAIAHTRTPDLGALTREADLIIPFIEGDGTGPDIWPAASASSTPPSRRPTAGAQIAWMEVLAGEKAFNETGDWLPEETVDAFDRYLVGIKGPLTTPVGGGIRSLNVALRQILDLYVCLRPVRWFRACPRR